MREANAKQRERDLDDYDEVGSKKYINVCRSMFLLI